MASSALTHLPELKLNLGQLYGSWISLVEFGKVASPNGEHALHIIPGRVWMCAKVSRVQICVLFVGLTTCHLYDYSITGRV